jgi:16S rRNA (cytidine1402-2'-O)-methyltransferase
MRELTKVHEETWRGSIAEAIAHFEECSPRGEFVLVLAAAPKEPEVKTAEEVVDEVMELINKGTDKKEALKKKASQYTMKKSDLYKILMSRQDPDQD